MKAVLATLKRKFLFFFFLLSTGRRRRNGGHRDYDFRNRLVDWIRDNDLHVRLGHHGDKWLDRGGNHGCQRRGCRQHDEMWEPFSVLGRKYSCLSHTAMHAQTHAQALWHMCMATCMLECAVNIFLFVEMNFRILLTVSLRFEERVAEERLA